MNNVAVFLDRDGVLNPDVGYPRSVGAAVLFPDVAPALRMIREAGYEVIVVTNQSGVGRGMFDMRVVAKFHDQLRTALHESAVDIKESDFYVCPHTEEMNCECRKPKPGLLLKAAQDRNLSLANSYLVGDKESDIEAGRSAGVKTILLDRSGAAAPTGAAWRVASLIDAALIIAPMTAAAAR